LREIVFEKDPPSAGFGSGQKPLFRPCAYLFRVHVKKRRGFIEIECFHGENAQTHR